MHSLKILANGTAPLLKNFLKIPSPIIWANKVTFKCNLKCLFCSQWKINSKDELSTEEFIKFMNEAKDLGTVINCFEGGEPLLREDLPILMKESKKIGFVNSIITNGLLLEKRMSEILPYTDVIVISIDGKKETHNKIRGNANAFDSAINAALAVKPKRKLLFNSVINRLNLKELRNIAEIAEDVGVPVSFCPAVNFEGAKDLSITQTQLKEAARNLLELKKEGFRILNSNAYLTSLIRGDNYSCRVADFFLTTDPFGNLIVPCCHYTGGFEAQKTAGIPLKEAWRSRRIEKLRAESRKCKKCQIIDAKEVSMVLAGRFDVLLKFAKDWDLMK